MTSTTAPTCPRCSDNKLLGKCPDCGREHGQDWGGPSKSVAIAAQPEGAVAVRRIQWRDFGSSSVLR